MKNKKIIIACVLFVVLAAIIAAIALFGGGVGPGPDNTTAPTQATEPTEPTNTTETTDPTEPVHTHEYTEEVVAPSCTEGGYTVFTCACGDSYNDNPTDALGHSYEQVVTDPTCMEAGFTTYTCQACEDTYTDNTVDAVGHTWGDWENTKEATTTEPGARARSCTACGEKEEEATPMLPDPGHVHDYSAEEVAATCTEGGYTRYTCGGCGDTYENAVTKPLGHKYTAEVTDPTCTEQGFTTYTCSVCADSYVEDHKEAAGHSWSEWEVVKSPTTEEEGLRERKCKNCDEAESESIPKLDEQHHHGYVATIVSPTCTDGGYTLFTCECGDSYKEDYTDALGHSYMKKVTEATCTTGGYTTYTCSACGDTYDGDAVEATGHTYGAWVTLLAAGCETDGKEQRICDVCGHKETQVIPATGHDYTETVIEATCTKAGSVTKTCENCGDTETATTEALGHTWSDWMVTKEPTKESAGEQKRTCGTCGAFETEEIPAIGNVGNVDEGEEYVPYIDPRVVVDDYIRFKSYQYGHITFSDYRTWGDPPSIWINEDGTLTIVYFNQAGEKVEVIAELPPPGFRRLCGIADDGTFTSTFIGNLG